MKVDAIVNTTNQEMIGYSGVDFAVHTAAGEELDAECARIAPLGLGEAKITGGYHLPSKYVIHTSGPVWRGGEYGEREKLISCYKSSLALAEKYGCETVAFPLISSGIFGYPKKQALKIAVDTISEFLETNDTTVYIAAFDSDIYELAKQFYKDLI
jgi:O-acetyl-ADP-ribose deacetylase (regulator of RNase III)